jgi:hypothetical protein
MAKTQVVLIEDHRTVPCEACGTEGRIYVADWTYDRNAGGMVPDQRDTGPCPWCEGTGGEIILTQPIELEDLP